MGVSARPSRFLPLLLIAAVVAVACVTSTSGEPSSPVAVGETLTDTIATPDGTRSTPPAPPTQVPSSIPAPTPRPTQDAPAPKAVPPPVVEATAPTTAPTATPSLVGETEPTVVPVATEVPTAVPVTPTPVPTPTTVPTATAVAVPATPTPPTLPPGSFQTAAGAMARAAEVGCSGFRGERVDGSFGYFPCGSVDEYEALISGGPFNLFGEACRLESNPDVRFTAPITDIDTIRSIIPSGSPAGAVIKPHGYIFPESIGGTRILSSIYAPADSWLQSVAYYGTSLGTNEYLLVFFSSCELSWRVDHVLTPVDSILAIAPTIPSDSSTAVRPDEPIFFKAGDLVAQTRGSGDGFGPWDFGAYNTTVINTFANQERYASATNTGQAINSVCPYDLYDEPLRSQFRALFGGSAGTGFSSAPCPGGRDVAGALTGAWFAPDGRGDGNGFAIALVADNAVNMTGAGLDIRVPGSAPTWIDPGTVTTSHCYNNGQGGWAFLELLDANTLAVAGGTGTCPASLPVNHDIFVR